GARAWRTDATARGIEHLAGTVANVQWAPGLRRSRGASLRLLRHASVSGQLEDVIELEPLLTFRMRGLGYTHPEWGHARWHGGHAVGSGEHKVEGLGHLEPWTIQLAA